MKNLTTWLKIYTYFKSKVELVSQPSANDLINSLGRPVHFD